MLAKYQVILNATYKNSFVVNKFWKYLYCTKPFHVGNFVSLLEKLLLYEIVLLKIIFLFSNLIL